MEDMPSDNMCERKCKKATSFAFPRTLSLESLEIVTFSILELAFQKTHGTEAVLVAELQDHLLPTAIAELEISTNVRPSDYLRFCFLGNNAAFFCIWPLILAYRTKKLLLLAVALFLLTSSLATFLLILEHCIAHLLCNCLRIDFVVCIGIVSTVVSALSFGLILRECQQIQQQCNKEEITESKCIPLERRKIIPTSTRPFKVDRHPCSDSQAGPCSSVQSEYTKPSTPYANSVSNTRENDSERSASETEMTEFRDNFMSAFFIGCCAFGGEDLDKLTAGLESDWIRLVAVLFWWSLWTLVFCTYVILVDTILPTIYKCWVGLGEKQWFQPQLDVSSFPEVRSFRKPSSVLEHSDLSEDKVFRVNSPLRSPELIRHYDQASDEKSLESVHTFENIENDEVDDWGRTETISIHSESYSSSSESSSTENEAKDEKGNQEFQWPVSSKTLKQHPVTYIYECYFAGQFVTIGAVDSEYITLTISGREDWTCRADYLSLLRYNSLRHDEAIHDPPLPKTPQEFVCKPCETPNNVVDKLHNLDVTNSLIATHSDCSSSSSESSFTQKDGEHEKKEQHCPMFSETWQHSASFNGEGGCLRKPGYESNLHVSKGAISSWTEVNISTAVCADFDKMLKLLEIRDDVHLASPLVEYWAGRDFSFVKDVTISLPHFIPPGIDAADVHVFCITSSSDGLKHESPDADGGDSESLETAKPLVASKQSYLHVKEIHHFHVLGDIVKIFTKHFCGFLCVYCDKETDKKPPRPKLYAMGGGQISTVNGQQHVDLKFLIWDERIKSADFRQNQCIRNLPTRTLERIELLEDFQDSQIHVNLKLDDEEEKALVHRKLCRGQALLPCDKVFDFPRFLACKKCVKKGKLEPKTVKWAFKSRPGVPRLQSLEIVVEIVHASNSQQDKNIMTPFLLRVQCEEQTPQSDVRSKKPRFWTRMLHSTSCNTPDIGASHSITASPFQQGNETISQAGHDFALPPPLQSLQRRTTSATRVDPVFQARASLAATERRSPRPRSQDLPQDASSASSSLEGAFGGCDVENQSEMTDSNEQVAELQRLVDQLAQRLEYETTHFQMEKQALESKTMVLENKTKVLEWQLRSLSETRPPVFNALLPNGPAGPVENPSCSDDHVEFCNPSVTTSFDADASESDSFHSCDDEELVFPECRMDDLK